ncbi:MAG TPA: hypothetical protein VEQ60_29920, partial [Longimicrobium sp.]|nr:hypothetical protein [Longimicrobium sp.]
GRRFGDRVGDGAVMGRARPWRLKPRLEIHEIRLRIVAAGMARDTGHEHPDGRFLSRAKGRCRRTGSRGALSE